MTSLRACMTVLLSLPLLFIATCSRETPRADTAFQRLTERLATSELARSPEQAARLGYRDQARNIGAPDRLDDHSLGAVAGAQVERLRFLDALLTYDPANLSPPNRQTYHILKDLLTSTTAMGAHGAGRVSLSWSSPYVINQMDGAYLNLPDFLSAHHRVNALADAQDYLSRLALVDDAIDDELLRLTTDARLGAAPPRFILEDAIAQATQLRNIPAENSVFITTLSDGLANLEDGDAEISDALVAEALDIVHTQVTPAYDRLITRLTALSQAASEDAGVWRLPHGSRYYKDALRMFTTSDKTPDEIHQLGLDLVASISADMDAMLTALERTEGSVGERMAALSTQAEFIYEDSDEGRAQLINDLNLQIGAMQARLPEIIRTPPQTSVIAARVPLFLEQTAPGGYYESPPLDGSAPGVYYINLHNLADWPQWALPTLTYHEATPGHHLQTVLQQQSRDIPLIRRLTYFPAYGEGWALYAEDLADEMGLYADDPYGRLGYLQSLLFRAARLVVDTGLHHKKWTRQEAIDYLVEITGQTPSSMEIEVERYVVWPGQACAYMIGREEIRRMRREADDALGADFSLTEFHDVVLSDGARPLSVLDDDVKRWINGKLALRGDTMAALQ